MGCWKKHQLFTSHNHHYYYHYHHQQHTPTREKVPKLEPTSSQFKPKIYLSFYNKKLNDTSRICPCRTWRIPPVPWFKRVKVHITASSNNWPFSWRLKQKVQYKTEKLHILCLNVLNDNNKMVWQTREIFIAIQKDLVKSK